MYKLSSKYILYPSFVSMRVVLLRKYKINDNGPHSYSRGNNDLRYYELNLHFRCGRKVWPRFGRIKSGDSICSSVNRCSLENKNDDLRYYELSLHFQCVRRIPRYTNSYLKWAGWEIYEISKFALPGKKALYR